VGIHRDPDAVPQQFDDAVNRHGRRPLKGWVGSDVAERLPGLELLYLHSPVTVTTRSPEWAKQRLRHLSTSVRGMDLLRTNNSEAPGAYRELFRSVGRDPDDDRPPLEEAYFERLLRGGFEHVGIPADALTITLAETGIPIWAVDAGLISGELGIRRSLPGEIPVPRGIDPDVTAGHLVVADDHGIVAELCREPRSLRAIGRETTELLLYSVKPRAITEMRAHEAFWMCARMLEP
jgi:DNA/RNA-binding domain of Phe-tRNA-synthetase-like protein